MNSFADPAFWKCYRRLPADAQKVARRAYCVFGDNPAHPGLRFERLASDSRLWSVRVTRDYRAVGVREKNSIVWFWVGTHEEFDRKFPRR